jgi:hypothetical protein
MTVTGWLLLRLLLGRRGLLLLLLLLLLGGLLARLLVKLLLLLMLLVLLLAVQLRVVRGLQSWQGWSCGSRWPGMLQLVHVAAVILLQLRIWWRRGERIWIHAIAP